MLNSTIFKLVMNNKNIVFYCYFQMWCATGVNLSGGVTKDGGEIVGASVFYKNNNNNNVEIQNITNVEFKTIVDDSIEMQKLDEELKVIFHI